MIGPDGLRVIERPASGSGGGAGRGRLVLVHGVMDRASSFGRLMNRLGDWDVATYDRRGYAHSSHLGPPADFDAQVADLLEVIGDGPVVAFGHSLGGDVVLATMAEHPGLITSALVWEPPQPWWAWWPSGSASAGAGAELDPEERAEWLMRRLIGDRIWERLPEATRRQRRSEGPTLMAELASIRQPVFDPADIHFPVLVGRGGKSQPHHRRGARELAALLPKGRLVEIPDSDHGAHLTHPTEVAALIAEAAAEATRP